MKVLNVLVLAIGVVALILGSLALWQANQTEARVEEKLSNVSIDSMLAMRSVAESFKMNGLQWDLVWRTPGYYHTCPSD